MFLIHFARILIDPCVSPPSISIYTCGPVYVQKSSICYRKQKEIILSDPIEMTEFPTP